MSYLATGFDGSITGMRGNIGIIDDPIKNAEEAVNESVKEKHWRFYKNTFASRMLDGDYYPNPLGNGRFGRNAVSNLS